MPDQKKEPTSPTGSIASTVSIDGAASEVSVKQLVRVTADASTTPTRSVLEMTPEAVAKHLYECLKTTRYQEGSDARFAVEPIGAKAILKLAASGDDTCDLSTAQANKNSLLAKVQEYRTSKRFVSSDQHKFDPLVGLLKSALASLTTAAKKAAEAHDSRPSPGK
jgi:hypothetical protein